MSRTAKTVQDIVITGLAPTMAAPPGTGANNGITFDGGNTFLAVNNAGAGSCTLTFDATAYVDGIALADQTATCTNDSATRYYGPFGPSAFSATIGVDFSLVTGVTCAVVRLPHS
jgi:hypothetical protein